MKLPPFAYDAPETVEEAVALLAEHGDAAKVLAGGQSLLPLMAFRLARPDRLIDIGRIEALAGIANGDGLWVGSTTTHRALERWSRLGAAQPLLAEVMPWIGHTAIRVRGTVGGSVAHADPAAELPLAALVLDATMWTRSARGEREISAAEFFQGFLMTALADDELLTAVSLPAWPGRSGAGFEQVARRHGDFALVAAAATVTLAADGTIGSARIGLCGVAATPVHVERAEVALAGQRPDAESFEAAAAIVRAEIDPSDDLHATAAYRRHVAGVFTQRVLAAAAGRAAQGGS